MMQKNAPGWAVLPGVRENQPASAARIITKPTMPSTTVPATMAISCQSKLRPPPSLARCALRGLGAIGCGGLPSDGETLGTCSVLPRCDTTVSEAIDLGAGSVSVKRTALRGSPG